MRKLITVFILLTLSVVVAVQTHSERRWNFNAEVGFLNNYIYNSDLESHHRNGFSIGVNARYTSPIKLSFETGLSYRQKGGVLEGGQTETMPFKKIFVNRMEYLSIPLLIGYEIKCGNCWSILPQVGGYLASGVGGQGIMSSIDGDTEWGVDPFSQCIINTPPVYKGQSVKFNKFDGGVNFSVAGKFKGIRLRLFYEMGLHKLTDYGKSPKMNSIGFSLGYEI